MTVISMDSKKQTTAKSIKCILLLNHRLGYQVPVVVATTVWSHARGRLLITIMILQLRLHHQHFHPCYASLLFYCRLLPVREKARVYFTGSWINT